MHIVCANDTINSQLIILSGILSPSVVAVASDKSAPGPGNSCAVHLDRDKACRLI